MFKSQFIQFDFILHTLNWINCKNQITMET